MGKWHLGYNEEQNPVNFGFDTFRGMLHGAVDYHSHINTFGRFDWWHNEKLVKEDGYVTDLITDHSLRFIEAHRDEPFFLFVSHLAIHFPWQTPDDTGHRQEGKSYRDVSGPLNKLGPHPPEETGAVVRTMIEETDKSVGSILHKLEELGLDKDTLVVFTSDNGGYNEYRGGYTEISSNGPLQGQKGSMLEGGHRVPAIAHWPGCIPGGSRTDQTALTMDLLPTALDVAGIPATVPSGRNKLDGTSLLPLLCQQQSLPPRTVFWALGGAKAARSGDWKLIVGEDHPPRLYHLGNDISESRDVASEHVQLVNRLTAELDAWSEEVGAGPSDS